MRLQLPPIFTAACGSGKGKPAGRLRPLLAGAAALLVANASAQVDYVRELVGTEAVGTSDLNEVKFTIQAPYETSEPDFSSQPSVYVVTRGQYFQIDSATGVVAEPRNFPLVAPMGMESLVSLAGQNTATPKLYFISNQRRLTRFDAGTGLSETYAPQGFEDIDVMSSLAARSREGTLLSFIGNQQITRRTASRGN